MAKRARTGVLCPEFTIVSGKVRITDPCYDTATWCSAEVDKVKNGVWNSYVKISDEGVWGRRCAELFVWHSSYKKDNVFGIITRIKEGEREYDSIQGGMGQKRINADIGVDSGQCGVFDSQFYKNDKIAKEHYKKSGNKPFQEEDLWYSMSCDVTLKEPGWGVIPHGAVSSSGIGDGSYDAYKCVNENKEIVGIRIVFL